MCVCDSAYICLYCFYFLSFCGNFSLFCDAKNQMYLFFAVFKKMRHIHRPTNNNEKKSPDTFFLYFLPRNNFFFLPDIKKLNRRKFTKHKLSEKSFQKKISKKNLIKIYGIRIDRPRRAAAPSSISFEFYSSTKIGRNHTISLKSPAHDQNPQSILLSTLKSHSLCSLFRSF